MSVGEDKIPPTGSDDLVPEFKVTRLDSGQLQAVALYRLTDEMIEYGCKSVLVAASLGELELLCTAERIKRSIVNAAVRLVTATRARPWRDG
jgi:dihydrodipicolinate synthase/N-acetylneuraminate lyase